MKILTAEFLESLGEPCQDQLDIFNATWPQGMEISLENALKAVDLGLDIMWVYIRLPFSIRERHGRELAPIFKLHELELSLIGKRQERELVPIHKRYRIAASVTLEQHELELASAFERQEQELVPIYKRQAQELVPIWVQVMCEVPAVLGGSTYMERKENNMAPSEGLSLGDLVEILNGPKRLKGLKGFVQCVDTEEALIITGNFKLIWVNKALLSKVTGDKGK